MYIGIYICTLPAQLALEGEVLLGEDVDEDVLLKAPPFLRVDYRLKTLVHLLRRMEGDVVLGI